MKRNNEEQRLQIASKEWFDWSLPSVLAFHCPNGGFRNKIEGAMLKRMGVIPGVPDWLLFWMHPDTDSLKPRFAAIELKAPKGIISDRQKEFREKWEARGGLYALCKSMEEIDTAVKSWGLQPRYAIPLANAEVGRQMRQAFLLDAFRPLERD